MIKNQKTLKIITLFLLCATILFNLSNLISRFDNSININEFEKNFNELNLINLKNSQSDKLALNYSSIGRNDSIVYRLFESVEFTVNTSGFNNVDYTLMQIDFSNNSRSDFNMTFEGNDIYKYTYSPKSISPLGFQNVSFLIYNASDILLNAHQTYSNFTIKSNYLTNLNDSEFRRDETVYGEIMVNDYASYNFDWNVTVVDVKDEVNQINLFDLGNNLEQISFKIDERFTQPEKKYYVKINMTDDSPAKKVAAYIPFKVLNTNPQIITASVNFSTYELKRTEECSLSINVSDADPNTLPENLSVSLILITSSGQRQPPILLSNNMDWTFSSTFSIGADKPVGFYQAIIEVKDQYDGLGTFNSTLTIKNNPPKINAFWINDKTIEEQISINYGEDIIFKFNVSDIEDSIAYVTVSLLNENNEWYNVSKAYSEDMELKMRSVELITGVWYVYISVTDNDGDTTHLTSDFGLSPKEIRIIPDILTPIMPWITLIIGLFFGVLVGIAFSFKRAKIKHTEKLSVPEKKEKKKVGKKKKLKPVEDKEELKEETIEEIESEEITEKKQPQRKIKRKLK